MENIPADFNEVKNKGEEFYKTLSGVYCSYFEGDVMFNVRGLEHLKFKNFERVRPESDQYMRFKLLHLAPEILKLSRTVQGILEIKKFERIRVNGRTDIVFKLVRYYEFIAVIKRDRVKVIVKQIEDGERFFWSIIPSWGMNHGTMARILHEGDPDED